jgi:serine protease AprX
MKSVRERQESRQKAVWGSRAVPRPGNTRSKVTWGARITVIALSFACALAFAATASAQGRRFPKMDRGLEQAAITGNKSHRTTVIVTLEPGADLPADLQKFSRFGRLNGVEAHVLDVPDDQLQNVANLAQASHVHADRVVHGLDFRTDVTSGSIFVNRNLGLKGSGIVVAVLDSGIASAANDLPSGAVTVFKDFVNNKAQRYDDYGHGTHVAGIIAGNGKDSGGVQTGIAPGAQLVVLKVLDAKGNGTVANVIAALDWLATYGSRFRVRVVNLSFGARPDDDPDHDPLALAAKTLVRQGMVVVAAAGNDGEHDGKKVWGGIPSPADAPWVLTVGASSSLGTLSRKDDQVALFSSRGPAVGRIAKPDIVASGVGIESTIASGSSLALTNPNALLKGTCLVLGCNPTPYMSLSGTSMAAPVVSGTVALMLQANPNLTPNLVKAILEYTAEVHSGYSALEQGAGFLNTLGAVRLATFFAGRLPGSQAPFSPAWSRQILWGNHRLTGGILQKTANAWGNSVTWGDRTTSSLGSRQTNVVWGTAWGDDNIVWGTSFLGDNIVWGTSFGDDNIVWGTECGGANCGDNIIWGTSDSDNIVWGTDDGSDNIVWGTDSPLDNIIWGTDSLLDNIVWGTDSLLDNIVWGTSDGDNIVWGTNDIGDNIVWGTSLPEDNIVWGTGFVFSLPFVKVPVNPDPSWFNNSSNVLHWLQIQFGDSLPNLQSSAR